MDSSAVASAGFDPKTRTLEVEYIGGGLYDYHEVGKDIWDEFQAAPSKGQFVNACVRDAFPYTRLR